MDSAMRDLDQLRERGDEGPGRKLAMFALAATVAVSAVFAMGILIGRGDPASAAPNEDPLAQLQASAAAKAAPEATETVKVEAKRLSFPAALTDDDPLVEASVAAAAAELRVPSRRVPPVPPLPPPPAIPPAPEPAAMPRVAPPPPVTPSTVPAAHAASATDARLSRVARHDPLVAAAMPSEPAAPRAPVGRDGEFTLQVVSYESPGPAEEFAKTLRARGHKAFVMAADVPGRGRFHRVRIGPFKTRREAQSYQKGFEADERMHTIVVKNRNR